MLWMAVFLAIIVLVTTLPVEEAHSMIDVGIPIMKLIIPSITPTTSAPIINTPKPVTPAPTNINTRRHVAVTSCGQQLPGKLTYRGGPIKNKVDVQPLMWPRGGIGVLNATGIEAFYKGITNSPYMDGLSEYCSPTYGNISGGLGRNAITLTPPSQKTTIDDTLDIQPFLRNLYRNGILKPNNNSYFPIHFAPGINITLSGIRSCVDFCAYHYALNVGSSSGQPVYVSYGVVPDLNGGICPIGCVWGNPYFDRLTVISSHELIETITDPVPLGRSGSRLLTAWYSDAEGENADMCGQIHGTVTDANNLNWTVSSGWSNNRNACYPFIS